MKDIKAQIDRELAAKLKSFGREDDAKDRKMMDAHETKMHGVKHRAAGGAIGAIEGGPARPRMDRGAKKKSKGSKGTTVNVVIAPKEDKPPMPMPMPMPPPGAGMPPMMPPKPPMPMGPPGGPLMPPPGMMPPGGGPGGPPIPMRAAGGKIGMTAGAASGEGRLEKAEIQKRKG